MNLLKSYIHLFFIDIKNFFKWIFKRNWKDYIFLFPFVMIMLLVIGLDYEILGIIKEVLLLFNVSIFEVTELFGSAFFVFAVALILISFGIIFNKSDFILRFGTQLLRSLLLATFIILPLKIIIGRVRPALGTFMLNLQPFNFNSDLFFSFPSGHTVYAFIFALLLTSYTNNILLKISFLALAVLTGLSRLYFDMHWVSDILFSIGLAYLINRWVCSHSLFPTKILKQKIRVKYSEGQI